MTDPEEQHPELELVTVVTDLATYNVYMQVHILCLMQALSTVDTNYYRVS